MEENSLKNLEVNEEEIDNNYIMNELKTNPKEEGIHLLIEELKNINAQDENKNTLLHLLSKEDYTNYKYNKYNQFYDYKYQYPKKEIEKIKQDEHEKLIKQIFILLSQKTNLNINILNNKQKYPFQLALENNNYPLIKELLNLNPDLFFIDENNNSIFHYLSSILFEQKYPINERLILIKLLLNKISNIDNNALIKINNLYNNEGFTPLLKLMHEYYFNIDKIFNEIKYEEELVVKTEQIKKDESIRKKFIEFEKKITNYKLNNDNNILNEIHNKALIRFNQFIEDFFFILKKYINDFKMNHSLKDKKSNNNILFYLMKYPNKVIYNYLIQELNLSINEANSEEKNCLYFLFDNINTIYNIDNNYSIAKEILNNLIEKGINLEKIDTHGNNPFLYLCINNFNLELLKILKEKKCDINKFNNDNINGLFYHIRQKNYENVKNLIEVINMDYHLCDNNKRNIMHYLCNDENINIDFDELIFDYLLSKNINLNQEDIFWRIPLHYLFVKLNNEYNIDLIDPVSILNKFLNCEDIDFQKKDIYGNTILHYACQKGSLISIITLLNKYNNIDINIKNNENNTPLVYSILFKHENIAAYLLEHNADINIYAYNLIERNNNKIPGYIKDLFKNEKKIRLFRICIRYNFYSLLNYFLLKEYDITSAIEDSILEQKFIFVKKLLFYLKDNKKYHKLNFEGKNLFHILSNIKDIQNLQNLTEIFDILYSKEIPLNTKDNYGNTVLHYASKNLFNELIKFICNKFINDKINILDEKNNNDETPLILGIKGNNINLINEEIFDLLLLVSKNTNNNNINLLYNEDESNINNILYDNKNYQVTILIYVIRKLLELENIKEEKDNIDYVNELKIKLKNFYNKLLKNGASIMIKDSYGKTCLHYCIIYNNFPMLKMLIEDVGDNIDKNVVDNEYKSLVHYCVSFNNFGSYENEEMSNYLLKNNFLYNSKDIYNKTPLYYSLHQKNLKNFKILQKYYSNIEINPEKSLQKDSINELDNITLNSIPEVDIEKDSKEFIEKKIKNVEYIDKQINNQHIYKENNEYWEMLLIKVDKDSFEFAYFYSIIKLIENLENNNKYLITIDEGKNQSRSNQEFFEFNSLIEAKNKFIEIYKEKTGDEWENRNTNFNINNQKEGKYILYYQKKVIKKRKEIIEDFDFDKYSKTSIIKDKNVLNLFKDIADVSQVENYLKIIDIDNEIISFSLINKENIIQGKNYLLKIYNIFNEIEEINIKLINSEDNDDINYKINDNNEKILKYNEIVELSKKFFDLFPREKCFMPYPLLSIDDTKNTLQTIVFLTNLEKCVKILLAANNRLNEINPYDYLYYSFQAIFESVPKESSEFMIIQKYINATKKNDKILSLIRIKKKSELSPRNNFDNLSNHYLLFHGTKIMNLLGIFSNGLNVPNTPFKHLGNTFGCGIYLSDALERSCLYANTKKNYQYILLCECALGNIFYKNQEIDLDKKEFLLNGYDSLKTISKKIPDPKDNFVCDDGLIIPCGKIIENEDPYQFKRDAPEYIIYKNEQIKLRYIVQIENGVKNN